MRGTTPNKIKVEARSSFWDLLLVWLNGARRVAGDSRPSRVVANARRSAGGRLASVNIHRIPAADPGCSRNKE